MEYFAHKVLLSLNTCCSFCGKALNSKPTTHKDFTFFLHNSDFLITRIPSFIFLCLFKKNRQKIAILDSHNKTNTSVNFFSLSGIVAGRLNFCLRDRFITETTLPVLLFDVLDCVCFNRSLSIKHQSFNYF